MNKKEEIKKRVIEMLAHSNEAILKNVDKALNSGAIDIEAWDENYDSMLVPKAIVVAVFTEEANQHNCKGSSHGKKVMKDAKNIGYFL